MCRQVQNKLRIWGFFILFAFFSSRDQWRINKPPFKECNKYCRFIIYYENFKTFNLIITNNLGCQKFRLGKTMLFMNSNVVLNCISNTHNQKAKLNYFIGHTTNTDPHRLICHLSKLAHIVHHIINNKILL